MSRRSGIVSLLNDTGEEVLSSFYKYPKQRKEILDTWRKRVGPVFNRLQLSILPTDEMELRTNRDGTNFDYRVQALERKRHKGKIDVFLNGVLVETVTSSRRAYQIIGVSWYTFESLLMGEVKEIRGYTAKRHKVNI